MNNPLPQLLSLSRMHAWKLFRNHQMFNVQLNLFFQPAKEWTPENEISCQWRGGDITLTPVKTQRHLSVTDITQLTSLRTGEIQWGPLLRAGEPSLGTKVTSLGPQVKSLQNGKRPPCHINSYQWHLPSDNQLICDSRLSTRQKSLASHVFLSAVCDSHFQFLSTFFTFNLIPPQLVSFMVRLEQNSLCLVFERMWGLANKEPSGASWHQVDPLGKQTTNQTWKPRLIPDTLSKSKVNIDDWRTKQRTT